MQKNLPIFLTCSVLALSFNGAVSFAQQNRQMAIPGQATAPITPPLMIEAGDWDSPTSGATTGRSLFADPVPSPVEAKKPSASKETPSEAKAAAPSPAAGKSPNVASSKQNPEQLAQKAEEAPPRAAPPTFIPVDTTKAAWGSLSAGSSTAHPPEPIPPAPSAEKSTPPATSDIGPRALPVKRPAASLKPESEAKKVAAIAPAEAPPPAAAAPAPAQPRFTGTQGKAKAPELAILPKGAVDNGDVLKMTRAFGDWTLSCDMQLDLNERVCRIEQSIAHGGADKLTWKIATKPNGRPIIVFDFSDKIEPASGLEVSFSGFEKSLPANDWACDNGKCQTSMDIIGPVAGWFSDAPQISFSFTRDGKKVKLDASMKGFQQAMAASQNPLGQKADPKASAEVPPAKNEKTAQLK